MMHQSINIHHSSPQRTIMRLMLGILLTASVRLSVAQPDGHVEEYLTREEALEEVFPEATEWIPRPFQLGNGEIERVEKDLRRRLQVDTLDVVLGYDANHAFLGYAVISEEKGKYRPITYIVGVDPDLRVKKVAVMVYREDRGGEVRRPRFLYQYQGKTLSDPIRTNRDILNISGATISVRSINAGVRKVLYLLGTRFRPGEHPIHPASIRSSELTDND